VPAAGHGEESRRDPNRQDDTMAESSLTQVDLERALAAVEEDLKMYGRQKKPGMTWMTADGRVFGAKADERGPIGGGKGYAKIVMDGDYRVSNLDELLEALKKVKTGQVVYVESDADIDCTTRVHIETLVLEIPSGVTLASNRGDRGSRGAVISSDTFATMPLLRAGGANVRITGLRIRGPDPKRRIYHHRRSFAEGRGHQYYYRFPKSEGIASDHPGLQVDNCELAGWSHAAVNLGRGRGHHIHHNYIHHNQYAGLGYGICLNESDRSPERAAPGQAMRPGITSNSAIPSVTASICMEAAIGRTAHRSPAPGFRSITTPFEHSRHPSSFAASRKKSVGFSGTGSAAMKKWERRQAVRQ